MSKHITVARIIELSGIDVPDRLQHAIERLVNNALDCRNRSDPPNPVYAFEEAMNWLDMGGSLLIELACAASGVRARKTIRRRRYTEAIQALVRQNR
ncbi:hypothetical protein [Rhodoplanes serenus]|uniref:hypothetical protein n=1 Tax=Rhodoplanes serenus TaxID=200615 RepID=UPI0011B9355C|nr:hypothetical protein [Rhodoplanes serenus]